MGRYKNSGLAVGTRGNPQQSLEQENFSGRNRNHSKTMPNYDKIIIDDNKFLKYSLDMDSPRGKDKAIAYKRGLGFDKTNYSLLKKQIVEKITSGKYTYVKSFADDYGVHYTFELPIQGPNGKTKIVVVAFQIDYDKDIPRLVTNYLK